MKLYGVLDEMPWGKYEGELVGSLIEVDPEYIHWMVNNTDFRLDEGSLDYLEECLK